MRIAMVSEHASPLAAVGGVDAGGQNVHVEALSRELSRRGHDVVVYTRRDDPALPQQVRMESGVVVHHVDAGPARYIPKDEILTHLPMFTAALTDLWIADPPDVVHAHFWMSALSSAHAATAARVPFAVTFHALGSVKRRHQGDADTSPPSRQDVERTVARHADRVIATSRAEVVELERMGAARDRISLVPCGVDTSVFRPDGPQGTPGASAFRLLSLGRLVPRKGSADAIRMLADLPSCELVIAGGPPRELLAADPEYLRLHQVAERTGVLDRVTFLGAVQRREAPTLIRSADLVVCLPWYEPFGIVPLEAMASGRPVVGSAVGGLLDSVEDGRTGVLVSPRDPEMAASAVQRLLSSPGLRTAMGQEARRRAERLYDWTRVAAATEQAYHRMRGCWPTSPPPPRRPRGADVLLPVGGAGARRSMAAARSMR